MVEQQVARRARLAPAYRMKRWLRISQVFGACDIADEEAIVQQSAGARPALRIAVMLANAARKVDSRNA